VPMTLDPASGVWSVIGSSDWKGKYYLYDVEVYVDSTGQVEHNVVTDPYSVSLSANSARSQIVDLSDDALAPPGWNDVDKPPLAQPEDLSLYELHVRDFSWTDETVPAALRGTYAAFAQEDSDGMRHLAALADAGLKAVHLLPTFDIATIEERRALQQQPAGDLSSYPPDGEQQQAAVEAVRTSTATTGATTRGTTRRQRAATQPTPTARRGSSNTARWWRRSTRPVYAW